MIRLCMYCKGAFGEKCPRCGATGDDVESIGQTATLRDPQTSRPLEYTERYYCHRCHSAFNEGDGGTTHGICDPCAALDTEARERKTSTGSRRQA